METNTTLESNHATVKINLKKEKIRNDNGNEIIN